MAGTGAADLPALCSRRPADRRRRAGPAALITLTSSPLEPAPPKVRHLLVTNDFPPKIGGIQTYLEGLWRRLPPAEVTVLTTSWPDAAAFDRAQPYRIERAGRVLLPTPRLARRVNRLASEVGADIVLLDPAVPLGLLARWLQLPYAVVLHGAEVTVPARLPLLRPALRHVITGAACVVSGGRYPTAEARRLTGSRLPRTVAVPPGVDTSRFRPLSSDERAAARRSFGLPVEGRLVVSVSRLVPRKGMDVLVDATARLARSRPDLTAAIAGSGRTRRRLERRIAERGAPVRLLGRVPDEQLPALYGCADVFAMLCRNRWGGLEQEGFGIVFLEAAACGVPQVAGDSGGAAEAVEDGVTGIVVRRPADVTAAAEGLARVLDDDELRLRQARAARRRAETDFDEDVLAARLRDGLVHAVAGLR